MHFFVELVKIAQNSPKNRIVSGAKEEADRHPMSGKRRKRGDMPDNGNRTGYQPGQYKERILGMYAKKMGDNFRELSVFHLTMTWCMECALSDCKTSR